MNYKVIYSNELYHHGIKGQKWGIRRFQNEDGTYTKEGIARYFGDKTNKVNASVKNAANKVYDKLPENVKASSKKVREGAINNMANNYKKMYPNMTDKEAKELASKRYELMKKTLISAAVVGGTAAVAYGGYKLYKKVDPFNEYIKAGTTIQNLSDHADRMEAGEAFYAAYKNKDKDTYKALFGRQNNAFGMPIAGTNKFKNTAEAGEKIKVAKTRQAAKVFEKMMENPEFAKAIADADAAEFGGQQKLWKAKEKLQGKNDYEAFNTYNLLGVGKENTKVQKMFYAELKKQGFGAIADVNDRDYSGFDTKAVMVFDKTALKNVQHTKVTDSEIDRATKNYAVRAAVKAVLSADSSLDAAFTYGAGAGLAGVAAINSYDSKVRKDYKNANKEEKKKK